MDNHQPEIAFTSLPKELDQIRIINLLSRIARDHEMVLGSLSYNFVPREKIIEINKAYLDHHYSTDIITFDYVRGALVSGEVFICPDEVLENAAHYGVEHDDELIRVIVHGLLHLVGFGDKSEKEKMLMRQKEDTYIRIWKEM